MTDVKKKNIILRLPGIIAKWFREMRSELKKVSWPTFKQVLNNTGIVLTMILIVGAFIALFDVVWQRAVEWLIITLRGF